MLSCHVVTTTSRAPAHPDLVTMISNFGYHSLSELWVVEGWDGSGGWAGAWDMALCYSANFMSIRSDAPFASTILSN